jgi:GMP synthase (glutamine-hydrolysing)
VVLALAPEGELQVARFATAVWGVQLHPEVDEPILRTWAEEDPDRYAEGEIEDVLARIRSAHADLVAGWRPLAGAFARLTSGVP